MKKLQLIILIFIAFITNSCEDVISVDLITAPPKLVVEASINWQKGTTGKVQTIKLTTTTDFYNKTAPIVSGATVYIKNSTNKTYNFIEKENTGEYICTNFNPIINQTYTLTIVSNGQTYNATETLLAVAPITKIIQNNQGGFDKNTIEIKAYFNDPANEDNYYLFGFVYSSKLSDNYNVSQDTFFQGNEFFSISRNSDLKKGDAIAISHYGISKSYSNYMQVLISIAGSGGGGPFQSPSATVRGNIINKTDFDNYALGYFTLSEVDSEIYTVQ